jgi:aryl-alcohol dehydrogenase-like predicted oxidoreductase
MSAILGLGTAPFMTSYGLPAASGAARADRRALVAQALEAGIGFVDTAAGYEDAEDVLGQLADALRRRHVRICTKLAPAQLEDGMDASLRRLGCRRVHAVLAHSIGAVELRDPRVSQALRRLQHTGAAERIGASTYGVEAARTAVQQPWCDMIQIEHSVVNPSVARAVAPLKRPDQCLVARSVLCQGLLSTRRAQAGALDAGAEQVLDRLEAAARGWRMSLPELAIRFALDTPGIDVVLVGLATPDELDVALAAQRRPPLTGTQRDILAQFEYATADWTHPERWQARPTACGTVAP